jgi:hypothetical protein
MRKKTKMANICRSLRQKNFFSPVLKSPTHIGFIGVKKNGSKISHLGTFKQTLLLQRLACVIKIKSLLTNKMMVFRIRLICSNFLCVTRSEPVITYWCKKDMQFLHFSTILDCSWEHMNWRGGGGGGGECILLCIYLPEVGALHHCPLSVVRCPLIRSE